MEIEEFNKQIKKGSKKRQRKCQIGGFQREFCRPKQKRALESNQNTEKQIYTQVCADERFKKVCTLD